MQIVVTCEMQVFNIQMFPFWSILFKKRNLNIQTHCCFMFSVQVPSSSTSTSSTLRSVPDQNNNQQKKTDVRKLLFSSHVQVSFTNPT